MLWDFQIQNNENFSLFHLLFCSWLMLRLCSYGCAYVALYVADLTAFFCFAFCLCLCLSPQHTRGNSLQMAWQGSLLSCFLSCAAEFSWEFLHAMPKGKYLSCLIFKTVLTMAAEQSLLFNRIWNFIPTTDSKIALNSVFDNAKIPYQGKQCHVHATQFLRI